MTQSAVWMMTARPWMSLSATMRSVFLVAEVMRCALELMRSVTMLTPIVSGVT